MRYGDDSDENVTGKALPSSEEALGARIKSIIKRLGVDVSVESTGKSARTLDRYASGNVEPPIGVITKLAERAGCSLNWLATGQEPQSGDERHSLPDFVVMGSDGGVALVEAKSREERGFTLIPRLEVQASAGSGLIASREEPLDFLAFQSEWLRSRGINPAAARVLTARGDSMEETIRDGDVLLVDTSIDRVKDNAIYIVIYGDMVLVKRVHGRLNGTLQLISDNPRYPAEEVAAGEADQLNIAGRVMWFGRSI